MFPFATCAEITTSVELQAPAYFNDLHFIGQTTCTGYHDPNCNGGAAEGSRKEEAAIIRTFENLGACLLSQYGFGQAASSVKCWEHS